MAGQNERHFCVVVSRATQGANDKAALLNEARWNSGDQIRVAFLAGDPELQKRVRAVRERWTAAGMANLSFQFVEEGDAEIRIAFQQGDGSWSYLGTQCRDIPADEATMNYGWLTPESDDDEVQRVVLHEFGHALGLIHEHQNPQGGIDWNEPAVIADLSGPPNNWDMDTIEHNMFEKYPRNDISGTKLDATSIMMYPIPASWTLDGTHSELNTDLSKVDKRFIRQQYP